VKGSKGGKTSQHLSFLHRKGKRQIVCWENVASDRRKNLCGKNCGGVGGSKHELIVLSDHERRGEKSEEGEEIRKTGGLNKRTGTEKIRTE